MIDILKAQEVFKEYLKQYDETDDKIALKIRHTYNVLNTSEYIAKELKLDKENIDLAKLIALLHDIGRFEQLKKFDSYNDTDEMDHAEYGIKILFQNNLIRDFIKDNKYDSIIYKSIKNHNKYKIEDGLEEDELLHSKLIRDSDKIDNFRVKEKESFEALFEISENEFVKEKITDEIYKDFMDCKLVLSKKTVTHMDEWVSYLAFIFDYNFMESIKYVKEKDYINKIVNRVKYEDKDTNLKMQNIRRFANEYIENKISMQ